MYTLKTTPVFAKNYQSKARLVVNQGGTGSGKTWALAQLFNLKLQEERGISISVVRKALPTLKATAMKDFFTIMRDCGWYDQNRHNKTELKYEVNGNEIEFFGLDDPQKVRSRKRHYLWMNEANEFSYEDFRQLAMRTSQQIFMDYNPSDEFHWIYEKILTRPDTHYIQSTYLANRFLEPEKVKEIERYKEADENYWKIYGLGERGVAQTTIYTHWQLCDTLPEGGELVYGLDFGYNNPTALVAVKIYDDDVYADEVLYESHLTNADLIDRIKELGIKTYIYCDSAEPNRIEELKRAGIPAKASHKSVKDGIDTMKSRRFFITKSSVNLQKEARGYRWKEKDGQALDEPVKVNDHLCFSGDTKVGNEHIRNIGFMTGTKDLYEYELAGIKIKATPEHPILTARGFVNIDALRYDDVIWNRKKLLFTTVSNGIGIRAAVSGLYGVTIVAIRRTIEASVRDFTDTYGKSTTAKSLKGITYIIKTATLSIMKLIILSVLTAANTLLAIGMKKSENGLGKISERLLMLLVGGQRQKKGKSLGVSGAKETPSIYQDIGFNERVTYAARNMLPRSQKEDGVTTIASKRRYVGREPVWALKTRGGMFQAEGIMVSNCDATRYAVHTHLTIPKPQIYVG